MKLNDRELNQLKTFLRNGIRSLPDETIDKLEIGIWIFPPLPLAYLNISGYEPIAIGAGEEPFLLAGNFGRKGTLRILELFLNRQIPYLLVRSQSWECYIECNGELLSEHCEENLDAVREACEKLRKRCGGGVPSVRS